MAERVTVPDMMNAREARAQAQRTPLARYPGAAVVCLCMNIAGPVKRTENIERAFAWGAAQVKAVLAPYETLFDAAIHEKTGPEAMICVRAEAKAVKKRLCALEDGEELGRLLDIDVIAPDGGKISRTDIGLPARRCLLCDKPAPVCARSRAHSVDALFERANALRSTRILRRRSLRERRKTRSARCSARWRLRPNPVWWTDTTRARTTIWMCSPSSTARARFGPILKTVRGSA